jgi:nicotinamidase/pyrazinamidase
MRGSAGQRKIVETAPLNPVWLENRVYLPAELAQIKQHSSEIYFLKQTYNMFDNPNLKILAVDYDPVVVFGVATDYCISAAVLGFRNLHKTVYLVTDAIKAVNPDDGRKALKKMRQAGALCMETDDILNSALLR